MEALLILSLAKIRSLQVELERLGDEKNTVQRQLKQIEERKKFVERQLSNQKYLKTQYSSQKK
jgi:hypothetical protein